MIKFDTTKLKPEHFKEAGFVTAAEIGPNNEHIFTYINDDYAEQLEQDNIDTDKIGAYATYEFISSHYNYEQDSQLFYIVPAPDCKDGLYTDFIAVLFDKGAIDVIIYEGLSLYKSMAAVLCDNSYNSAHTAETLVSLLDRVVAIAEGRKAPAYFSYKPDEYDGYEDNHEEGPFDVPLFVLLSGFDGISDLGEGDIGPDKDEEDDFNLENDPDLYDDEDSYNIDEDDGEGDLPDIDDDDGLNHTD